MKISYNGIGQWRATFACDGLIENIVVKLTANNTVSSCTTGEAFAGVVASVSHESDACSVVLSGLVTVSYTGTAPTVGYCNLSASESSGVQVAAGGRSYLVVQVDTVGRTVTFKL